MATLPNIFTTRPLDILLLPLRLAILLPIVLPLTLLLAVGLTAVAFVGMFVLATICLPFGFCEVINEMPSEERQCRLRFCWVFFYPFLCIFSAIFYVVGIMIYPCYRKRDHHGAYDGIDKAVSGLTVCYLGVVKALLHGVSCR
jgi:hypothetical protein